uniref:DNA-directed RNA polymerase subunit n=1 Tax=Thermosporothrix sp. COM3 TaxID=2490863 RepID=A0A455SFF6_9CHLR|nr:DNA-directed RNA polymerase subunit beta' [Thermosporothrix sp. COM3]
MEAIRISLAGPEHIRGWSSGEVTKPETVNYLTLKPEKDGLFCERIFGPTKDWSCACGKYRKKRLPGTICEKCGVELAPATVRRERMGHIELALPVAHPWYARRTPSILGLLLDLSPQQLSAILTCQNYLVVDSQQSNTLVDQQTAADLKSAASHRSVFTGAQALQQMLRALDLDQLSDSLRTQQSTSQEKKRLKRLAIVEALRCSSIKPEWMILTVLPVLPPELRPMVPLHGARLATSDLNVLYERVIHRNQRIKHLLAQNTPEILLNNEYRLLQQAVDALFDNQHMTHPQLNSRRQPLKSLTDQISGKYGRFRHHLLGKRVDYSGRSVIVGNAQLKLHQCGLPTDICLELFKPFVIRKLLERNLAPSPRAAKRLIERPRQRSEELWDLLEEVMFERVVLLNRAPTLHRLSIQAFEPVRVEGKAIHLHPLVCSAFNADFDGDQMAVHLPLSEEAQAEARHLMLSTHNLRHPASGEPSISISQEMVLGLFYLTQERPSSRKGGRVFADSADACQAYEHGQLDLHTPLVVRLNQTVFTAPGTLQAGPLHQRITTTVGRLLFHEALPPELGYRNYAMTKEAIKQLVEQSLHVLGNEQTAMLADKLKQLGFHYATRSGISFAISDIVVPAEKHALLQEADAEAEKIEEQYSAGMMTGEERSRQLISHWTQVTEHISSRLEAALDPWGSLSTIIQSGATKAKFQQIRQLSGIRGLLARPNGTIIETPVRGNYLQGLSVGETFIAASAARNGFMGRSLNTATTGYLTRKLVEAGMEAWITTHDCGTTDGLLMPVHTREAHQRLVGRVLAEPTGAFAAGTLIEETMIQHLTDVPMIRVRSPLTCQAPYGLCRLCYGSDLATGKLVNGGTAVGILAGQSIGEPGTQLSMKAFHSGGIANAQGDIRFGLPRVIELFEARRPSHPTPRTPLTTGALNPHEILVSRGSEATARYLLAEIQHVFQTTGVSLHDKHIEVILRQQLRSVQILASGDTALIPGATIDRFTLFRENAAILAQGGHPALARPILLGLSQSIFQTASWLAAASFQETSRVLSEAALLGKHDMGLGFKEHVLLGKRIPTSFLRE